MTTPPVSIIMAVHNGAADVDQSIPSVLSQDFEDFEFIIVDDASSDATPELISGYDDPRIVYRRNETNRGQTASLNLALQIARGEWIARIDADDRYLPGKLARQMTFLAEHPEIDVLGTWAHRVARSGRRIGGFYPPATPVDVAFHLTHGSPLCHVSVVMRRDAVLAMGGYDESYRVAADFKLWSDMHASGYRLTSLPEVLMEYREDDSSFGRRDLLDGAADEASRIIQSNFERIAGISLTRAEARAIFLRTAPAASLSETAKGNNYLRMMDAARRLYVRVPTRLALRLFLGTVWSMARSGESLRADTDLSDERRERVRASRSARLARALGRSVSWIGSRRVAAIKERVVTWGFRGYA